MKNLLLSLLSSGLTGGSNTKYIRKIRFLNSACIILSFFTHFLIFKHLSQNLSYLAILDISILLILAIIIVYLRSSKNIESASSLFLLLLINITQYFLITSVVTNFAIIWIFSFPVIAALLKDERKALLWSMTELGGLFVVWLISYLNLVPLEYSSSTLLFISCAFFFFAWLIYYLVNTNKIGENILIQKSNDLYKTNIQLAKEVRDRKETELMLKQENVRDEAIFSSIGEGMIVLDQDFLIVMLNQATIDFFHLKDRHVIGKNFYDHIHLWNDSKKRIPRGHDLISKSYHTKKIQTSNQLSLGTTPESVIPVNLTISPIILYEKVVGGVLTFRDITREKEVDRMKTEFISLASHQLRTPLTAMKWFLEMLQSGDIGPLSDEQKNYIKNIQDSNEKEIALVNSLLNISRIESGRIIIDPIPTQINSLIEEVVSLQKVPSDAKKLAVSLALDDTLPEIPLDAKLMREIITNLLTNAIKYTPENGTITIKTTQNEKNIMLSVSDTGYGIPENEQKRIFERFFRASNITKVVTDGSGLGLYLVKKILDASGGTIELESKENTGTTFTITLPIKGMEKKKGEATLT